MTVRIGERVWHSRRRDDKTCPDAADIAAVREVLMAPPQPWTMDVSLGDVALMAATFRIGSATALCCGQHDARGRFQVLRDRASVLLCDAVRHFDLCDFGEMTAAVAKATQWHVDIADVRYDFNLRTSVGILQVVADGRSWHSQRPDRFRRDGPEMAGLLEYLNPLAPLDAHFGPEEEASSGLRR